MAKFSKWKLVPIIIGMVLLTSAAPLWAVNSARSLSGQFEGVFGLVRGAYASDVQAGGKPTKPEYETLQGNGTPVGHVLSHGGIVEGSESVTVNGVKQYRDVDYKIDYAGGSLAFARIVALTESISVSYRYVSGDTGARSVLSVPGMSILNNGNLHLNLTYAYHTSGNKGDQTPDTATYGLAGYTKLGSSSLKSMVYFSSPMRQAMRFSQFNSTSKSPIAAPRAKSDHLMSQNADIGLGKARLQIGYQDIGLNFNGFAALRDGNSADAATLAQLEKEKGLKRMSLGLQFGANTSGSAANTSTGLYWNSVRDKTGEFYSRGFNYSGKSFGFFADMRGSDGGFTRAKDLSDAEKTAMALQILRQFNPSATAAQITAADKLQLLKQVGLERGNYGLRLGPEGSNNWLQMTDIGDKSGGVQRTSFKLAGKSFNLYGLKQSIDASFTRLSDLTVAEKLQFGNERGMDRFNIGGDLKFSNGMLATMAFSKVDDQNGGLSKQSFGLKGKTFDVKANFLNIDPTFTRVADLADLDKVTMAREIGFRQMDVTSAFSLNKYINVKSFIYNARNNTAGLDRHQLRNEIVYMPDADTKLTLLSDNFSFGSQQANISSYGRAAYSLERRFGKGLLFTLNNDVLETRTARMDPVLVTRRMMHLETDKTRKWSLIVDTRQFDLDNGKFDNSIDVNYQYSPSAALAIKGRHLELDRGADPSSSTDICSVTWKLPSGLSLIGDLFRRGTNNEQDAASRKIMLMSGLLNTLGLFTKTKVGLGLTQDEFEGVGSREATSATLEATVFCGNLSIEYRGLQEPNSTQLIPTIYIPPVGMSPYVATAVTAVAPPSRPMAAYKFVSDRDPKKWLHFDASYKKRDTTPGNEILVRAYNLDAKVLRDTTLTYKFFTYQESAAGVLTPVGSESIRLISGLGGSAKLVVDYRKDRNYAVNTMLSPLTIGLGGKLRSGAEFEIGVGRNIAAKAAGSQIGKAIHLKYDHKINAGNYLNFQATITRWNNGISVGINPNEVEARIDYKASLDW